MSSHASASYDSREPRLSGEAIESSSPPRGKGADRLSARLGLAGSDPASEVNAFAPPAGLVAGTFSWYFPLAMPWSSLAGLFRSRQPGGEELSPASLPRGGATGGERRSRWGLALVVLVMGLGIVLERAGVLDWEALVTLARGFADRWWLAPALALVTAVLYAAGLPGSAMVWVLGIVLPPTVAAPAFVAGGVAGALGAYSLARLAGGNAGQEAGDGRLLRLFARRSDFATLLAVRLAPSFPHSAINMAAGFLAIPRGRFLAATALGLAIKGTVYVTAIHQAVGVSTMAEAISWRTIAPLSGLTALLLLGPALARRLRARREPTAVPVKPV